MVKSKSDSSAKGRVSKYNPTCRQCGALTKCTETYQLKDRGFRLRRVYVCTANAAHGAIRTDESLSIGTPITVLKSDGRPPEPFDMLQLIEGLQLAATPEEKAYLIHKLCKTVTDRVVASAKAGWKRTSASETPTITSQQIGDITLEVIAESGRKAMWIRFALVFLKLDKRSSMESIFDDLRKRWDSIGSGTVRSIRA